MNTKGRGRPAGLRHAGKGIEQDAAFSREQFWEWDIAGDRLVPRPRCYALQASRSGGVELGRVTGSILLSPGDLETVRGRLQLMVHGSSEEDRFSWRHHAARPTGDRAEWVLVRGRVSRRDANGLPDRLIGSFLDLSATAHTDPLRTEGDPWYQALLDAIPDMLFLLDAEGVCVECHTSRRSPPPARFLGRPVTALLQGEQARATLRALQVVRETGRMQECRYVLSLDGEERAFEVRMVPVREGQVFAMLRDVTEYARQQEALRENEERYRGLVEQANSIVLRFDVQGTLTYINPYGRRFFGFARDDLVGRSILGTIVPERESTGRDLRRMIEELCGEPHRFATNEHENLTSDGRRVWVRWHNRALLGRDGKPVGVQSIGMDISERKLMEARLAENEARYQAFLFASPAAIVLVRDGGILYINPFALGLLGLEAPGQVRGRPVEELIAAQDLEAFRERMRRCEPGEGGTPIEIHVLHRDGSSRVLAMVSLAVRLEDGPAVLLMGQDVSERRLKEHRARLEAERLRSLVEIGQHWTGSVPDLLDRTLRKAITLTRSSHGAIWRYHEGRDELALDTCSCPMDAGDPRLDPWGLQRQDGSGVVAEVARERRPFLRNEMPSTSPPKRVLAVPVFSGGRIAAVVGVIDKGEPYEETDTLQLSLLMESAWSVVEQRQAEEALKVIRLDLARAQEVAHIGSWRLSMPGEQMHWSEETHRIVGVPAGSPVTYASFLEAVHPEDRAMVNAWEKAVLRGQREGIEHRILAEGVVKWVHSRAQVERDPEGRTLGGFGTIQDITEHKKLEAQFLQAQKMEAMGRLAGGVAHDFNNLLTVIGGNAELALARLDSDDGFPSEELHEIKRAVRRAAELTHKMLTFSRHQVVERKVVDLNAVLADVERMLRRLIGENIELVTTPAEGLPPVRVDPGQIEQVLTNLAINARDAMPDGGRLTLESTAVSLDESCRETHPEVVPGLFVQLSVSDTGVGMSEEVQSHLFEPFYTTKPMGKGTGLGLSTCYGIVKQNGGFIWVYSEEGRGTTVKVYLPAVAEAVARDGGRESVKIRGGDETILLVDDEAGVRTTAERILVGQGYRVLTAGGGQEALEIVDRLERPPDLLVTDVVMPGLGGRELAERLTARCPALKVLFISGYTDDVIAYQGIVDKGVGLLSKPFSAASLGARVREVLDLERAE